MSEETKGQKVTAPCPHCGFMRDPTLRCPKCGHQPDVLTDELARVNKAIAEMNQRDIQLKTELKKNSQTMQAALHQRNLLISTEAERQKKGAPKQRPWSRRGQQGPAQPVPPPPPVPPKQRRPRQTIQVEPHLEPEASPRLVQNVLLALAPLLLGITAVIFALVDLRDNVNPATRLSVLGIVTALLLVLPQILVRRGLFSTAESLATVGLGLLPVDGYVVAQVFQGSGTSQTTVYGIIFAVSAVAAFVFHQFTGLTSARYMVVLFSQPVLPLLAWDHIRGPAGWALVFAIVAAQNALIAWGLEHYHRPTPTPTTKTSHWLWEGTWILHGLALGTALVYAISALLTSSDVAASSRAALTLLLAAAIGVLGSLMLRKRPLGEVASGLLTFAIIVSAARVALIAIPGNAILIIAIVVFGTSLALRALPAEARRGPQFASAVALGIVSLFVVGEALQAAIAPTRAALPLWTANVEGYQTLVAQYSTGASWRLVVTIALITGAAFLALPPAFRRESAIAGAALTVLAAPASLHLGWVASIWLLTLSAVAFLFFWVPITARAATAQSIAFVAVALGALGVGLARQWSTAGVLAAITIAGAAVVLLHRARPGPLEAQPITDTAAGAAAFAAPGAVATGVLTLIPGVSTGVALTVGYLAASATLAMVTVRLVAHRRIGIPLAIGTGLGALLITGAAFGMDGAEAIDAGVGALLLAAAILLALAPSIDEGRRADRVLDGADVAAAAVTIAVVASLARTAELLSPRQWMFQSAVAVLIVAIGVRALPAQWRRGPSVGAGIAGAVIGAIAGYHALAGGVRAVTTPGELFEAQVSDVAAPTSFGWQVPAALVVLAIAAAVALPRPRNYDAAAGAIVLATLGAPAELGWPWWSPIVLGLTIATVYAIASTVAVDARAGYARLTVAIIVGLHALLASLVLLWTFAAALAVIALLTAVVAGVSSVITRMSVQDSAPPPSHLEVVGGTGLLGALLTGPAAVAAYAAHSQVDADAVLTVTILTIFGMLGLLLLASRYIGGYLGWGTVGIALSSTAVAVAALILNRPAGVYAAAAVLFVVLAELLRANARPPATLPRIEREERLPGGARRWRMGSDLWARRRWPTRPGSMAAAGTAAPAIIAVASLAP
ncbi:permease, partial [Allorhizocola rhizosphaerae]|uniref:permease n=1 Tax=Allorhizocola rhizosphaerae TaxID=1872709 RepID=UPI000E3C1452